MKLKLYILSALATTLFACDDPIYTDSDSSPIKTISVTPQILPRPISNGGLAIVSSNTDSTYNFIKINKNGDTTSTKFQFYFHNSDVDNPNNIQNPNEKNDDTHTTNTEQISNQQNEIINIEQTQYIDISDANFRKNSNDEFYIEYYASTNFGRYNYAIVKFDQNANLIYQIDSTVNIMGTGANRSQNSTIQIPVDGTPLNDGGYAMIFQTPSANGMQFSTSQSYDLTMRIIGSDGVFQKDITLPFDENIVIDRVNAVSNYILLYYQNENSTGYEYKIYDTDGTEITSGSSDTPITIQEMLIVGDYLYMSGYNNNTSQNFIAKINNNGEIIFTVEIGTAFIFNVTEADDQLIFTGFKSSSSASASTLSSISDYIAQATSVSGIIITMNSSDGSNVETTTMSYNGGVVPFSVYSRSDGGFDIFLTRIFAYDIEAISTTYGNKIYVYNTNDIQKLQID